MKLDTDAQAIISKFEEFKAPPIETLSPENARNSPTLKNAVEEIAAQNPVVRAATMVKPMPQPVGPITHQLIPGDNGDILARVFTPKGEGPFPVMVYFHGGGFVIANLDVYEPSCRALCHRNKCIVVSVAYRQAPEYKYPAAVEDAYTATQWVMKHAARLNGDPNRVAIAGESAGGNLATVTCLKARDEGGLMPIAQLLIYPVTDARMLTPSYQECANAKPLNTVMMHWFWKHYLQNSKQGLEPNVSPILAESLSGLPPAIVITAENDPLRDDGESYAMRMKEAGVQVSLKRYAGTMHEFFGLSGVMVKAMAALEDVSKELQNIFQTMEKIEHNTAKV